MYVKFSVKLISIAELSPGATSGLLVVRAWRARYAFAGVN